MSHVSIQAGTQTGTQAEQSAALKRSKRWYTDVTGWLFVLPFLILYALFLIWPVILGLRMSFFNWSINGHGTSQFLGLANYQELFGDPAFWGSLWVTIQFTIISTPLLIIIALALALLVNRSIPARGLFRAAFFASFILPVSVVALIWSWLYEPGFGLVNGTLTALGLQEVNWLADPHVALLSVVIVTVWWTIGFNFLLYLAGLQQIPQELNEAASIDGAGAWSRLRWVTIPLLARTTTLILILQVVASLQVFGQAFLLEGSGPGPASSTRGVIQYIYESGFTSFRVGFAASSSFIFFILILLVSLGQFMLVTRQRRNA